MGKQNMYDHTVRVPLILAGPSEFGAVGVKVPEGTTPNEYDGQLYLWDPASDEIAALTVDRMRRLRCMRSRRRSR